MLRYNSGFVSACRIIRSSELGNLEVSHLSGEDGRTAGAEEDLGTMGQSGASSIRHSHGLSAATIAASMPMSQP
jgi:hypothetical protein